MLSLQRELARAPHRYGYFEALRRLQRAEPARPRIGHSARPAEDALRLAQPPSLAFAASTLAAFVPREGRPPRLEVNCLGLFGPHGPLPTHLTEYAYERAHNAGDTAFARFADIFHHRMLGLFFRAWATGQPAVDMDRPQSSQYRDQIGALIGIGRPPLRDRDAMPDSAKLHHAGRLAGRPRNPEGLQTIVADLFGLPVAIEEFVAEWIDLHPDERCRLGAAASGGRLGSDAMLGQRTWSAQHKFRLRLGPMAWDDYRRFLPGEDALERLQAVVRNVIGDETAWDLELVLQAPEVPPAHLGDDVQLGWSAWLGQRRTATDAADLKLDRSTFSRPGPVPRAPRMTPDIPPP
jgi:type VI secretion system protein ImpH